MRTNERAQLLLLQNELHDIEAVSAVYISSIVWVATLILQKRLQLVEGQVGQ